METILLGGLQGNNLSLFRILVKIKLAQLSMKGSIIHWFNLLRENRRWTYMGEVEAANGGTDWGGWATVWKPFSRTDLVVATGEIDGRVYRSIWISPSQVVCKLP